MGATSRENEVLLAEVERLNLEIVALTFERDAWRARTIAYQRIRIDAAVEMGGKQVVPQDGVGYEEFGAMPARRANA